jgi:UDP-galactopyranose mutase
VKSVLVVGAGFAGAIVARQLTDAGHDVTVMDKRPHIGGNAYDELNEHGIRIHRYGPHLFNANDDRIVEYLSRFTDWWPYEHKVLAAVDTKLIPLPINRTSLERFYGVELKTERDAATFLAGHQVQYDHPAQNVEEVMLSQVGQDIYEAIFAPYTVKMWGIHPKKLDPVVVGRQRVRLDRNDVYSTSKFQAMPADGYTAMFERILAGIHVELGRAVDLRETSGWDHVVWTGPVDEAFGWVFGELPWRSLQFEHRHAPQSDLKMPVGTLNFPAAHEPWTRISEWRHFTGPEPHETTTLTAEVPQASGEPYYPIPSDAGRNSYRRYVRLARQTSQVSFVGRLARYQYLAMHQVVGSALAHARRLHCDILHI